MGRTRVKRGDALYKIMCEISARFTALKEKIELEILRPDDLSVLAREWRESLGYCQGILDRSMRKVSRVLPAIRVERSLAVEGEILTLLRGISELARDSASVRTIIPNMIRPKMDRLSGLVDEYVCL